MPLIIELQNIQFKLGEMMGIAEAVTQNRKIPAVLQMKESKPQLQETPDPAENQIARLQYSSQRNPTSVARK